MHSWTLQLTDQARKGLKRIDRKVAASLLDALDAYATTGQGDIKKLKGMSDRWRLRVGDYRAIFRLDADVLVVLVLRVGHRRDVYRD